MSHASTAYICLHPGGAGTHATGHTRDTGAHGHTDARITQTKLTTIPTHQRYTNAPTRTTTETANSRNPDSGTRRVGPEVLSELPQAFRRQIHSSGRPEA